MQILLLLPAPLTDSALAVSTSAPTVSNYYVTPTTGDINTNFNYYATYTDSDGQWPTVMQVEIDGKNRYNMTKYNGTSPVSGLYYYFNTKLSSGPHSFKIIYNDGNGTSDYNTSTVNQPTVDSNILKSGYVTPTSGGTNTVFSYYVTYSNYYNLAPFPLYVYISGSPHNMTYISGSNQTGALYKYSTKLGVGSHNYYFWCSNANGSTRLPSGSGSYSGPDVADIKLVGGNVKSTGYNTKSNHTFHVEYSSTYNLTPTQIAVVIDGKTYNMTYASGWTDGNGTNGDNKTGAVYKFTTKLGLGSHYYYFFATNQNGTVYEPETGWYYTRSIKDTYLINDNVNPTGGSTSTVFTYTVQYKNINNVAPTSIMVYIDYSPYNLTYVSGSNISGAIYKYSTTLSSGTHQFYFYCTAPNEAVSTSPVYLPNVNISKSFLSNGGVSPSSGYTNTIFRYTVTFTNPNSTSSVIQVFIDSLGYIMNYVSGNNATGVLYEYKTTLSAGTHNYYFYAYDSGYYDRLPSSGSYSGPSVSSLSSTLTNGKVTPTSGDTSTNFKYTVTYTNPNNTAPLTAKVYIDDVAYTMAKGTGNYSTGVEYSYLTTLSTGQHNYYFKFTLTNQTLAFPSQGNISGPTVTAPSPSLLNGKVTPNSGYTNTNFKFTVTYKNPNNTAPSTAQVFIDDVGYNMTNGTGSYTSGVEYSYSTTLSGGQHNYYFKFTTTTETLNFPAQGNISGPYVYSNLDQLATGAVYPTQGDLTTNFEFNLSYSGPASIPISDVKIVIDDTSTHNMSIIFNSASLKIYQYKTTLAGGNHSYHFIVKVNGQSVKIPSSGNYSGPTVIVPTPSLLNGKVSPTSGFINTVFKYTVIYKNPDDAAPLTAKVFIDDVGYNMTNGTGSFTSGVEYNYNTTLSVGQHNYYFKFTTTKGTLTLPSTGNYSGPSVKDQAPKLTLGTVSPTAGTANSTVFEFSVIYSDLEGQSPVTKLVHVNNSDHDMIYKSGTNKTGAKYVFTTKLPSGNYQFYFRFYDGTNTVRLPVSGSISGPSVSEPGKPINYPPELKNGTVSPKIGTITTQFVYRVYYSDKNSDPAKTAKVYINNTAHSMTSVQGDYYSGMLYEYKTTMPAGTHTYYFQFTDINNSAGRAPAYGYYTGPTVSPPPNQAPVLFNGSVTPVLGNTSTKFTYRIYYKDAEKNIPTVKYVYIDGVPKTMSLTNTADFLNGALYEYSTNLSAGSHNYYFLFNDSKNSGRYPSSGVLSGPTVTVVPGSNNTAPYLYSGKVYPISGTTKTTFTYSVYYYDADNDTPTKHHVVIDGKLYEMKFVNSSSTNNPSYYRGLYTFSTTLAAGNHTYHFVFSDGSVTVRLPKTGNYNGPSVRPYTTNKVPVLTNGRVSPNTGDTDTEFTYSVLYRDADGDAPTTYIVYVDGVPHKMSYVSGAYKTNATYEYKTKLSAGWHYYYFLFSDGKGSVRLPVYSYFYGPIVTKPNSPPIAEAGADQLHTVGPPKTVWFDGSNSSDPDNDRLKYFWEFGDGGYAYGEKVFHVFHGVGTYNVTLTVSDGKLTDSDNLSVRLIDSGKGKTQGKAPAKDTKLDTGVMFKTVAGTIAGTAVIAGIAIAGTEWGIYGLLGLLIPLYVRIKKNEVLDNFTRGKIYGYIIANPGDHYNSIKSALKLKNGSLAYHLKTLEREELIKSQTDGKFKRFYPYEMDVKNHASNLTTMRKNIVEKIKEKPGITQNEISEKMGVSHQAISYHLRTLVQLGAVNIEKNGRSNNCYPGQFNGTLELENEETLWT